MIVSHYKKIGYNLNVTLQTASIITTIEIDSVTSLFNCTTVSRALTLKTAPFSVCFRGFGTV